VIRSFFAKGAEFGSASVLSFLFTLVAGLRGSFSLFASILSRAYPGERPSISIYDKKESR
jgi:hypothetical protein